MSISDPISDPEDLQVNINIHGNNNDSNLILSSTSGSINDGPSNPNNLTENEGLERIKLISDCFDNPASDGCLSIGYGDFGVDPNTEFGPPDPVTFQRAPLTAKAGLEYKFQGLFTEMVNQYGLVHDRTLPGDQVDIKLLTFDNASELLSEKLITFNGSAQELHYLDVTRCPLNVIQRYYESDLGIAQLNAYNGNDLYDMTSGASASPTRKVIFFSSFNKYNGIGSVSLDEVFTKYSEGFFITFVLKIRNIKKYIDWIIKLATYLKQNNADILVSSPVNKGFNVMGETTHNKGGVEYNKNYFEKEGVGDYILHIGFASESGQEKSEEFLSLYNQLKSEQTEEMTYKTNLGDNFFFKPVLDETRLNDGKYDDGD